LRAIWRAILLASVPSTWLLCSVRHVWVILDTPSSRSSVGFNFGRRPPQRLPPRPDGFSPLLFNWPAAKCKKHVSIALQAPTFNSFTMCKSGSASVQIFSRTTSMNFREPRSVRSPKTHGVELRFEAVLGPFASLRERSQSNPRFPPNPKRCRALPLPQCTASQT
jgi:hypothetical protein